MQFPIIIGLRRSRILDAVLCLLGVFGLIVSLAYPGSSIVCLGLATLSLLLAAQVWRALTPAVTAIRLERSGDVLVRLTGNDVFMAAELEPVATVHAWLTVIRLKLADGRRVTLIAAPDSQDQSDFRRLRMFMRWQAKLSGQDAAA